MIKKWNFQKHFHQGHPITHFADAQNILQYKNNIPEYTAYKKT